MMAQATFWSLRAKYEAAKGNVDIGLAHTEKALDFEPWRQDVWKQRADIAAVAGEVDVQREALRHAAVTPPEKSFRRRW